MARAEVKERVLDAREDGKLRWNGNAHGYEHRAFRGIEFPAPHQAATTR